MPAEAFLLKRTHVIFKVYCVCFAVRRQTSVAAVQKKNHNFSSGDIVLRHVCASLFIYSVNREGECVSSFILWLSSAQSLRDSKQKKEKQKKKGASLNTLKPCRQLHSKVFILVGNKQKYIFRPGTYKAVGMGVSVVSSIFQTPNIDTGF